MDFNTIEFGYVIFFTFIEHIYTFWLFAQMFTFESAVHF